MVRYMLMFLFVSFAAILENMELYWERWAGHYR